MKALLLCFILMLSLAAEALVCNVDGASSVREIAKEVSGIGQVVYRGGPVAPKDPSSATVGKLKVIFQDNSTQDCSSFLEDISTVLTSAHCFVSGRNKNLNVKAAEFILFNSKGEALSHQVKKVYVNPKYVRDPQKQNANHAKDDIAVLILESPIRVAIPIDPVWTNQRNPDSMEILGYGFSDYKTAEQNNGQAEFVQDDQLRFSNYGVDPSNKNRILPADLEGGRTCEGDSGGPVIGHTAGQSFRVGIISRFEYNSRHENRCYNSRATIMTRISDHLGFIESAKRGSPNLKPEF